MVIGITGTNGSGKGTVVEYLVTQKGFVHYPVRDFLTKLLVEQKRVVDRSEMRLIANELRAAYEPAYVIKQLHTIALAEKHENVIIESIRNVGEAVFLKSVGAFLVAVDADQKIRFTRVGTRRSVTDQIDFATFVEHEEREMHPAGPYDMDIRGVMALADYTLTNDGTMEEFHKNIESMYIAIKKQNIA